MKTEHLPSIIDALQFRQEQMGYSGTRMAKELGIQRSHYNEILKGKRRLSLNARIRAHAMGVPAKVLLQPE